MLQRSNTSEAAGVGGTEVPRVIKLVQSQIQSQSIMQRVGGTETGMGPIRVMGVKM
jgi:hypothetical protein